MKIAICISGQPRNFKQSYASLKKCFLDKYDCDVYFHSWKTPSFESTNFGGGSHQYSLTEQDYKELVDLYQPKGYLLEQPILFDVSGYKCPIWRQPLNNTLSMFYSMHKSFELVKGEYDYVLRTRFDIDYFNFVLEFPKDSIMLPQWNTDNRVKHRGYSDLFALGKVEHMKIYFNVFPQVISYVTNDENFLEFLSGGWPGQDSPLRNEYLLKWHLINNNVKVTEFFVKELGILR